MKYYLILFAISLTGCSISKKEKAEDLYMTNCSSCHLAPSPKDLPKHLWKESVLPEMAARMGIKDSTYSPYAKYSFQEQEAIMKSGIYNVKPMISNEEWKLLKEYIITLAPEKLDEIPSRKLDSNLNLFNSRPINLDSIKGSSITFLDIEPDSGLKKSS